MNNLQPSLPERHFSRSRARYQVWSWAAILASILMCLLVSWLYLRHSELFAIVLSIAAILLAGISTALILAEQARNKVDAALSESELRFRRIFDNNMIPMGIYAPSGEILDANEALLNLVGYTTAEMKTGQFRWDAITPGEYRQRDLQVVREIQQKGFCVPYEKAFRHKDGRLVSILIGGGIFDEQTGAGVFYVIDLTERKRAELALQRSETLLKEMGRIAQIGGWELDTATMKQVWTDETYVIHDRERGVYDPSSTEELSKFVPGSKERIEKAFEAALAQGTPYDLEVEMTTVKGNRKWVRAVCSPLLVDGKVTRLTGTVQDITERRQVEQALRESEERLALVMEGSQLGYWDWNIQTGEVHRNALWAEMLGYTLEEIALNVRQWTDLHHPDDRARAWKSIQDHLDGITPAHRIEYRMRMKDGQYKWILDQARVVKRASDGKPLRMSGTHTDITERVHAEENVRIALAKYQTLFDSFPLGITVTDKTGNIVETNRVAEELLGLSGEEQRQREIDGSEWRIIRTDGTPMPVEEFASVRALRAGRKVDNVEMGILKPDGETTWINVTAAPLPVEGYGVVVTYGDITGRKNMQHQLQENERNYRELVQNANSAIIRYKRSGEVSFFNEFAQTLFGYSAAEILGKPVSILLPETDSAGADLSVLVQNITEHPEQHVNVINQNICHDGRRVWMTWTNKPIYDQEGKVTEILTVGTDITELKQFEGELRRSNAELEQFAYVASHDLQEPLRTVSGMVQMLQKRYEGQLDARADEYIHFAVDASERMQQLINDLLDFSRVERKGRPFAATNMEKVLQAALSNLQMAVDESGAQITHDPLPSVMADGGQLTQVLQNLIGNAIKFRGEQPPEIHLSAEKVEHGWQFAVQDNGIGIDPQYFERIFLIFQRLHTRKKYPGTGIGLALCKKIIERHGGQMWIESELKHGATFYFTLPERS